MEEPPTISDYQTSPEKGMEKSERQKTSKREDGVDLMSNMPDNILVTILSRLPSTEEVIRTSILSSRWRYMWTSVPSIELNYPKVNDRKNELRKIGFQDFVYWVLANRSVDLDCITLNCEHHYSMSTVGRWIHLAITRNVKKLHLIFCPKDRKEDIVMPHCLVTCSSLEVFTLQSARGLRLPKNSTIGGFGALRALHLNGVDLLDNADLVKDFLGSCPVLEELKLLECQLFKLDLLCISCSKLKKLTIMNIENYDDDRVLCGGIKICCPKLVDLNLTGDVADKFLFESLDSLHTAVIITKWTPNAKSVLFPGISGVEYLWINPDLFIECINAASDPTLPNLKTLVLTASTDIFTMEEFNRILNYYPKLESLKLLFTLREQDFHGTKYEWLDEAETRRFWTPDVKRVEFFEFNGEKPKVVIEWSEGMVDLNFSWGNEARFSNW